MKPARLLLASSLLAPTSFAQWSTSNMPSPLRSPTATALGDKVLFGGGIFGSGTVHVYDDGIGTWTTVLQPVILGARASSTSVGRRALLAGGFYPTPQGGLVVVSDVVVYDDATGTWTTTALSSGRGGMAATTLGSRAYFAGGHDAAGPSCVIDIFDDASGLWTTSSLPNALGASCAVSLGSSAYFCNGTVVDVLDGALGTWSALALPSATGAQVAVAVGARVLFTNGAQVDLYDSILGTWTSTTLSCGPIAFASTTVGTKALFAGGSGGVAPMNVTDAVDVYDDATGLWTTSRLSLPRFSAVGARLGTRAFFFGGSTATALSTVVDIYEDALGLVYCSPANSNSTGHAASIRAQGFPGTVAQGYTLLTAGPVPPQAFGMFLASRTQGLAPGPAGSQGDLCLGGSIGRFIGAGQVQHGGQLGVLALTVDLTDLPQPTGSVSAQPGETWNFQAWYRDANPGPTSNFTDAVSVTFQ